MSPRGVPGDLSLANKRSGDRFWNQRFWCWPVDGVCFEPVPLSGLLHWLAFIAPFADEVEASLEQWIVGWRRGSGQGEDGGGEG